MKGGLFFGAGLLSAALSMAAHAEPMSIARGVADAFLGGDVEKVWERSTPDMREVFGSVDEIGDFRAAMLRDFGEREAVLSENVETRSGHDFFTQVSRWSGSSAPVQLVIALDTTEKIAGFLVKPQPVAAPSPYLNYRTRAALHLPVGGAWYVYWGGRKIDHNYHAADTAQRFAIDLLAFERFAGSTDWQPRPIPPGGEPRGDRLRKGRIRLSRAFPAWQRSGCQGRHGSGGARAWPMRQ